MNQAIEMDSGRRQVLDLLARFRALEPGNDASARLFEAFVRAHPDCARRELDIGHLTGAAWLVSRDGARVLLTHHRKLGRWLQLGGHADGDLDLARVALREAEEESGLSGLTVQPEVFDLDRHWIPQRGNEPGHWHYDLRFVVRATDSESFVVGEESHALEWREIAAIVEDEEVDASIRRMARRWMIIR